MKKKILIWIKKWLEEEESEWSPKKSCDLKAVSYTMKQPKSDDILCQTTEWDNGEGYDFVIYERGEEKFMSLGDDKINLMLACLNDLGYFKE